MLAQDAKEDCQHPQLPAAVWAQSASPMSCRMPSALHGLEDHLSSNLESRGLNGALGGHGSALTALKFEFELLESNTCGILGATGSFVASGDYF